jgi:hypothetical protein
MAVPALRPVDSRVSLTPLHIPVQRLPAFAKSLPAISRMKARSRGQPTPRIARSPAVRELEDAIPGKRAMPANNHAGSAASRAWRAYNSEQVMTTIFVIACRVRTQKTIPA